MDFHTVDSLIIVKAHVPCSRLNVIIINEVNYNLNEHYILTNNEKYFNEMFLRK